MILGYLMDAHGNVIGEVHDGSPSNSGSGAGLFIGIGLLIFPMILFALFYEAFSDFGYFLSEISAPIMLIITALFSLMLNFIYCRKLVTNDNMSHGQRFLHSLGTIVEEAVIAAIVFFIVQISSKSIYYVSGEVGYYYWKGVYFVECLLLAILLNLIVYFVSVITNVILKGNDNQNALIVFVDNRSRAKLLVLMGLYIVISVIYVILTR